MKMTSVFLLLTACCIAAVHAQCDSVGFDPIDRDILDTAQYWTYVSNEAFSKVGTVHSFDIFVGATGRALRVGIYRPKGSNCEFELVQQKEWSSFPEGLNTVKLTGADVFQVREGDRYGFTWLNLGVLDFTRTEKDNYCEDIVKQDVGSTVNLVAGRHSKREYSIRMHLTTSTPLGFDPIDRDVLDTAEYWTYVSNDAFSADGEVYSFDIFVGATGRALRVGIYRPKGSNCGFDLVQQKEWTSFPEGLNTVRLSGDDVFQVQKGDRYGFTWLNFGVLDFTRTDTDNYCENIVKQDVGSTVDLVAGRHSKRAYSIRMHLTESQDRVGFEPIDRDVLDTAKFWTYVSNEAFSANGKVRSFDIFVGATGRALRVGIYRPKGSNCGFDLVQQKEWPSFPEGLNTVKLSGDDVFQVQKGDRYGFTWLNFGVLDFTRTDTDNYCENIVQQDVGSTVELVAGRHSKREYSIRMALSVDPSEGCGSA